uniref:Myosin_tail_1 domain-containing protein n=1 Tax=Angiostrongylus cantonensis TaxID=6313 RepID=A0A0K0D2A3_ANGCA
LRKEGHKIEGLAEGERTTMKFEIEKLNNENLEKNRKEFSECHERELAAVREQRHLKEDDFRSAMDKVHVLTEEKAVTDSELANLQEMLEQKQSEHGLIVGFITCLRGEYYGALQ